ncbi:MAG: aldo/keto reductase [Planctomycetia bacterium]|nr:aldo/keto reductase [Planctomycetia bacterium]
MLSPMPALHERRPLGLTGIEVSPVALGCWPISGMTSLGVNDADSLATLHESLALGINFLDTAYCYGADGESERLIARALRGRRDEAVIATKGGIAWGEDRKMIRDARPETLRRHCEESLRRLETDHVELLYLHGPDNVTPLADSAGELKRLMNEGKTRSVGVSNFSLAQLIEFHAHCPITAFQPNYNMIQRQIEADSLPWCRENHVAVAVYWPLMKGLLAGKLARDHVFDAKDGRAKYSQFQGEEWVRNQELIDRLRPIAEECGRTLAQMAVNWTIHQPGITSALCGAKRPEQIRENAGALGWRLTADQLARIDAALEERGAAATMRAVT